MRTLLESDFDRFTKVYLDSAENLGKALKAQSMKVSELKGLQYKLSYVFATSASGQGSQPGGAPNPLDTVVQLNLNLQEFPNAPGERKEIKFAATKDKFLQFSRDMKEALALMQEMH